MRLKTFINENRSEHISYSVAQHYIERHCKKALSSITRYPIYRGNRHIDGEYFLTNPKNFGERKSPFADENYYNLLLSNLPAWSQYPKRNKSVICTTDYENASNRGRGIAHYVLPVDGAKIGVCPRDDIWDGFRDAFEGWYDLSDLNDTIYSLFRDNGIFRKRSQVDFSSFVKDCLELDKIKNLDPDDYNIFSEYIEGDIPFIKYLNDILDPEKNGFKLVNVGENMGGDNEVWTDSPCILIDTSSKLGESFRLEENL